MTDTAPTRRTELAGEASTRPRSQLVTVGSGPLAGLQPFSGAAFILCFIGSVIASSPPANNAADQKWIANYTGSANHAHHILTGVLLVLAGISLVTFLSSVWTRIARATSPVLPNPLPLVAAAVAAACMAAGGMVMGATYLAVGNSHAPNADVLRLGNGLGFALVGIAAMLAVSLSVACLTAQGRAVGIFSRRMSILGVVTAVALLAAFFFIPIVVLLVWVAATMVVLRRTDTTRDGV